MAAIASSGMAAKKPSDPDDLFNPLLGIDYSHWLVGPIAMIASAEEIAEYLQLTGDEEAERFIAAFWERRNAGTEFFQKTPQQIYESRLLEADKRFTEAAYPGRRTDRGTILVTFGEPETIEFESPKRVGNPTLEIWRYPKDAAEGLGGEKPKRLYRFCKQGELTVFYAGVMRAPRPRERQPF
ncbi:MAG: GWxTD domain-containing protein [bacterium]|nr:GWxTD domain-containing protein [bacterium]